MGYTYGVVYTNTSCRLYGRPRYYMSASECAVRLRNVGVIGAAAAGCRATSLHSSYAYIACDAAHSRFMVCFCVILRLWRILCKGCFNGSTSWLLGLAAHHIYKYNTYTHAYSSIYTTHIYVYTLHMYTHNASCLMGTPHIMVYKGNILI